MDDLLAVIERLRAPDGCPWDRAQTAQSMAPYLIEEAYEAAAALQSGEPRHVTDELGDVLFTVLLIARIREQAGLEGAGATATHAAEKMIRRHPRLFGHPEDQRSWDAIKADSADDGPRPVLPALLRAQKVGRKAARRGFDWPDATGPRAKIEEELQELDEALVGGQVDRIREELGDLLFSIVNLARHVGVDAEIALTQATSKFERRFRRLKAHLLDDGQQVDMLDAVALESTWQKLKEDE